MKVVVEGLRIQDDRCSVQFSSETGEGWAYWQGEIPEIGASYDVEVDLPAVDLLSVTAAFDCDEESPRIASAGDSSIVLQGKLLRGDDGFDSILLGDIVVLLDSQMVAFADGQKVVVKTPSISFFPFSL